jgi:hypothetical protein
MKKGLCGKKKNLHPEERPMGRVSKDARRFSNDKDP